MMKQHWNCIVCTCPNQHWASAIEKELKLLQKKGFIPLDTHLLTIEDPGENIGSGAATLNALLVITEFLSSQNNFTVITADVLQNVHILILHHARDYVFDPCGKSFISIPKLWPSKDSNDMQQFSSHNIYTNIVNLLDLVDTIAAQSPPSIWICSTDMLLISNTKGEEQYCIEKLEKDSDVVLFYVSADVEYATGHGVLNIDTLDFVQDIIYCGSKETISHYSRGDGTVPLVAGVVCLSIPVAESLLSVHAVSPINSCNYMGVDSGAEPLQVSLFFDILIAMASSINKETFLSGQCGKTYNKKFGLSERNMKRMMRARSIMWEQLSQYKLRAKHLKNYKHLYLSEQQNARKHVENLFHVMSEGIIHTYIDGGSIIIKDSILLNSLLSVQEDSHIKPGTFISHTFIEADYLSIGKNCFINGIKESTTNKMQLVIPDEMVAIGFKIYPLNNAGDSAVNINAIFGIYDSLLLPITDANATFCNISWNKFFAKYGLCAKDIWDENLEEEQKILLNAKLYTVSSQLSECLWLIKEKKYDDSSHLTKWKNSNRLSLNDILKLLHHQSEFEYRRELYASVTTEEITQILLNNKFVPVIPYFLTATAEEWDKRLLNVLDKVCDEAGAQSCVLARTLSCIADLLGTMAGKSGGVRSGPGNNKLWISAYSLLQSRNFENGVHALKIAREQWLDRPDRIMRAARHYEAALQILIRNTVLTAKQFIEIMPAPLLPFNQPVIAECPARIDFQGGWTDTPPICYELGGSVTNMAVLFDGTKPIGAKAYRIKKPEIVFILGKDNMSPTITINEINQLRNYNQPNAEASLLKAAIICTEIVDINEGLVLSEQLMKKYQGGFILQTWSLLPEGTGLGTSSVLAAAVISVLWTVSGKSYNKQSILHAVLYLEQLLTTGGGWQDQVGGVIGGIKRAYSRPELPIHIEVEELNISRKFVQILNNHLLLLYTGKVRLAKNILQNVIRNWYAREKTVVGCFKSLLQNSHEIAEAFQKENLQAIGNMMNVYWKQKKLLAPGCEPLIVKEIMDKLAPHTYGQLLVGAGGGGFMCILTIQPCSQDLVRSLIQKIKGTEKITFHSVSVAESGIDIRIDNNPSL